MTESKEHKIAFEIEGQQEIINHADRRIEILKLELADTKRRIREFQNKSQKAYDTIYALKTQE